MALVVATLAVAPHAFAQTYPTRPIQMIVPFTAGNVIDVLARAFAHELSADLKQPIVINNVSGASGILALNAAASAAPDGYTLLFAPQGQLTIQPHLKKDLGYKFETFKPICQLFDNVFAIIVSPNSPIRTFQDLLDRARAKPGALTWATSGTATVSDLQMSALIDKLGLKMVHVPYRNYGQMIQDTIAGNFDFAVPSVGSFNASTVHMVALLADKRVPLFPDLVTIGELGYPISLPGFSGLYAPAKAPKDVIERLSASCPKVFAEPGLQRLIKQVGGIPAYLPGDKFTERLIEDSKQKAQQIKAMGLDKDPK
jgi:tripartite-type tricarboxylate transporter receptor subunit TctC